MFGALERQTRFTNRDFDQFGKEHCQLYIYEKCFSGSPHRFGVQFPYTYSCFREGDAYSLLSAYDRGTIPIRHRYLKWGYRRNNISDAFNLGRDLISIIGQSMPVTIFPPMMQLAPAHIQASHWARQQAGILAIGLVADEQYIDMIPDILNWLHTFLTQENPRLKWASLIALGLLCSEFQQSFQIQFHNEITSGISGCLGPENCSKVIAQAAKSLINYSQLQGEVVPTVLLSYIPGVFQKYYTLLSAQQLDLSILSELTKSLSVLISLIAAEASAFYTLFIHN